MKTFKTVVKSLFLLCLCVTTNAQAEDIDIFTGTSRVNLDLPNVIFVLDNSANWSRQAQKWPGGVTQGQSEVRAMAQALEAQIGKINVGLIEYSTAGSADQNDGGYVRFNLQELTPESKDDLDVVLQTIFDNINDNLEKRGSSNPYGDLPWDLYNYLTGDFQSKLGGGTPTTLADTSGYSSQFDKFDSPLNLRDACGDNYVIFIGNNTNGSIAGDSGSNSAALKALYQELGEDVPDALAGDSGTPLAMPEFVTVVSSEPGEYQGVSAQCWKESEVSSCSAAENSSGGLCDGLENCSCTVKASTHPGCQTSGNKSKRTYRWKAETGATAVTFVEASGNYDTTGGLAYNFDDWAKFMYNYGIPLDLSLEDFGIDDPDIEDLFDRYIPDRLKVITYTIDVFNKQQQADLSELWFSAAENGGGRYFQAKTEDQILNAINTALGDILSVSTSFAAVTMPLSATNRARVDNQVYIGMFRPTPGKKPRWYGNLKRYQIGLFDSAPRLADVNLRQAINPLTGFARECAASYWSSDSDNYWENLAVDPPPRSQCALGTVETWSDLPDGPFVEKGGVSQQVRELASSNARTVYTVSSANELHLMADSYASQVGGDTIYDYLMGDIPGGDELIADAGLRHSIHGDVVHSRPLAIRHTLDDVTVYYGANGGPFRAIDPDTGVEKWALVAPEHFDRFQRLYDNSPLIDFAAGYEDPNLVYEKKDYFFDGPTGRIVMYNASGTADQAYIYPTMRRGGRVIYGIDVTDPDAAPDLMWRLGCPSEDSDTGCTTGFSGMGQTWSMPVGGHVGGYLDDANEPKLIVAFGGGYDECLDEDVDTYPSACSSAKGKGVYVVDALTGVLLAHLDTDAPVVAEVSTIDIDFNGTIDFAYAADAAGGVYRIDFAELGDANPENSVTALAVDDWSINKIATMSSAGRRFLNAPTAAAFQGNVIVTIGSGDRERPLETHYPYREEVQNRFYAFIDKPYLNFVDNVLVTLGLEDVTTVDLDGITMLPIAADTGDADLTNYDGWYMNLPDRGEQVVNASVVGGGKVFFNTFQPGGTRDGICRRPLGIGTGYQLDLFNPTFTEGEEIEGSGIPIPPVIATVKVPPGYADCVGEGCAYPPEDPCATGNCEVHTLCIGCLGFEPVKIEPVAPPTRQRVYFSENIDEVE